MEGVQQEGPPPPVLADEESLEALRSLLWRVHQATVEKDDPILMAYTIHRAALSDFQKMLDAQTRRFSDAAHQTAEQLGREISSMIDDVKAKALNDAIRERLAAINEAAQVAEQSQIAMKKTARRMTIVAGVSMAGALLSLAVLALLVT